MENEIRKGNFSGFILLNYGAYDILFSCLIFLHRDDHFGTYKSIGKEKKKEINFFTFYFKIKDMKENQRLKFFKI